MFRNNFGCEIIVLVSRMLIVVNCILLRYIFFVGRNLKNNNYNFMINKIDKISLYEQGDWTRCNVKKYKIKLNINTIFTIINTYTKEKWCEYME